MTHLHKDEKLEAVRNRLNLMLQQTLRNLSQSDEMIELPILVQFSKDVTFDRQQAKSIAETVMIGIVGKQILIAVSHIPRPEPIEVGYLEPAFRKGKFITAIISPDCTEKLENLPEALKKTIVDIHALDLMSIADGVQLISHEISLDSMVYSINLS